MTSTPTSSATTCRASRCAAMKSRRSSPRRNRCARSTFGSAEQVGRRCAAAQPLSAGENSHELRGGRCSHGVPHYRHCPTCPVVIGPRPGLLGRRGRAAAAVRPLAEPNVRVDRGLAASTAHTTLPPSLVGRTPQDSDTAATSSRPRWLMRARSTRPSAGRWCGWRRAPRSVPARRNALPSRGGRCRRTAWRASRARSPRASPHRSAGRTPSPATSGPRGHGPRAPTGPPEAGTPVRRSREAGARGRARTCRRRSAITR